MKRILAPILLLTLLFPALAQGQSLNDWVGKGKGILCETTGMGCPESVDSKDLVERDGVYFKKRTDVPFTGKTTGDEQGSLKNGKKDGLWISYRDNGQLWDKVTYKDGKVDGPYLTYHENGRLEYKGTYKVGKKNGPWVSFHEDGQLWFKGTYEDGKNVGVWVNYYKNGQLWSKGTYKNGKRVGPWIIYHDNGQLMSKGIYKNGEKVGPWVSFHEDGTVWEEYTRTYKNGVKIK
jgi:antitoxin component YwqK of YwqJK toxin-antitoxin module